MIDPSQNYYIGASQGGIMGGALTAIAPDFTRSVLNVPAMNYSVLLPRSVDYDAVRDLHQRSSTRRSSGRWPSTWSRCSGTAASRTATPTG